MAGGSITEQVISYYTNYQIVPDGESNHFKVKKRLIMLLLAHWMDWVTRLVHLMRHLTINAASR